MMKLRALMVFLCFTTLAFGQQKPAKDGLIQFSGIVTDLDSGRVIPYVTISNLSAKGKQTIADYRGYFTFIANPGDTVVFTAIGYFKHTSVIPQQVVDHKHTEMVKLKAAVINLPAVRVSPWATVEEFNNYFITMKIADDDMAIAKRNLSRASIDKGIKFLPRDGQEISSQNYRYDFNQMVNKNMVQTIPLLNPFAWSKFMQQIFDGDKKRKEDNN